jgi:hypothetical protein
MIKDDTTKNASRKTRSIAEKLRNLGLEPPKTAA